MMTRKETPVGRATGCRGWPAEPNWTTTLTIWEWSEENCFRRNSAAALSQHHGRRGNGAQGRLSALKSRSLYTSFPGWRQSTPTADHSQSFPATINQHPVPRIKLLLRGTEGSVTHRPLKSASGLDPQTVIIFYLKKKSSLKSCLAEVTILLWK